jgi:hypothetical protein
MRSTRQFSPATPACGCGVPDPISSGLSGRTDTSLARPRPLLTQQLCLTHLRTSSVTATVTAPTPENALT